MCLTNDCCDDSYNGRIVLTEADNPNPTNPGNNADIEIVGQSPIRVAKTMRGTTTVYTISLYIPAPPTTSLTVTPTFVEFNKPFTALFTGTYAKGSENLVSKIISPLTTPVADTSTSPFTFSLSDTPTQVGKQFTHTLTVIDATNQVSTASAGIDVFYRYYRGLVARNATLNIGNVLTFESGLGASIQAVFGAKRHYINASGSEGHFCWLRPVDSPQMGIPVGDGNFPFETKIEPYTLLLNGAEYNVIKTINFYPTSTDVELSF